MAFCSNCGKPVEKGGACSACGQGGSEAMLAIAQEMRRGRRELRLLALAMAFVFCVSMAVALAWFAHRDHTDSLKVVAPAVSPQSDSAPVEAGPPLHVKKSPSETSQESPAAVVPPSSATHISKPADSGIDTQAVQDALKKFGHGTQKAAPSTSEDTASSASDRYPGSEPVDVKDAAVPDVGIPVASQVYATTDAVSKVMDYYKQLYPDAQVMEISGQNIIAVDRPGETKVIAIGSGEGGTRIAIVRPE